MHWSWIIEALFPPLALLTVKELPVSETPRAYRDSPGEVTQEEHGALSFALGELEASAREISRRSSEQFTCVTAALLTLATVIGLVSEYSDGNLVNLLAAVPWVHAILGYIWVDHHYGIMRQGTYIRTVVEPAVQKITNAHSLGREGWCSRDRMAGANGRHGRIIRRSRIGRYFPWLFFLLPSVLSVTSYCQIIYRRHFDDFSEFSLAGFWDALGTTSYFPLYLVMVSLVFIIGFVLHIFYVQGEVGRWAEIGAGTGPTL